MPPHQYLERRLIALLDEALQELTIAHAAPAAATDETAHILQKPVR
jgi:hypothetical protein